MQRSTAALEVATMKGEALLPPSHSPRSTPGKSQPGAVISLWSPVPSLDMSERCCGLSCLNNELRETTILNMEKSSCESLSRLAGSSQVREDPACFLLQFLGQKANCWKARTVVGKQNVMLLVVSSC